MPRSGGLGHVHSISVEHVRVIVVLFQLGPESVVVVSNRPILRLGWNVSRRLWSRQSSSRSSTSFFGLSSVFALFSFPLAFLPSSISSSTRRTVITVVSSVAIAAVVALVVAVVIAVVVAVAAVVSSALLSLQIVKVPFLNVEPSSLSWKVASRKRRRLLEPQSHVPGICALVSVVSLTTTMVTKDTVGAVGASTILDIVSPDQMALVLSVDPRVASPTKDGPPALRTFGSQMARLATVGAFA